MKSDIKQGICEQKPQKRLKIAAALSGNSHNKSLQEATSFLEETRTPTLICSQVCCPSRDITTKECLTAQYGPTLPASAVQQNTDGHQSEDLPHFNSPMRRIPTQVWEDQHSSLLIQTILLYGENNVLIYSLFPGFSRKELRGRIDNARSVISAHEGWSTDEDLKLLAIVQSDAAELPNLMMALPLKPLASIIQRGQYLMKATKEGFHRVQEEKLTTRSEFSEQKLLELVCDLGFSAEGSDLSSEEARLLKKRNAGSTTYTESLSPNAYSNMLWQLNRLKCSKLKFHFNTSKENHLGVKPLDPYLGKRVALDLETATSSINNIDYHTTGTSKVSPKSFYSQDDMHI